MIATFWCPALSSASRIAATRPSIMSEGATMSAPASAWQLVDAPPRYAGKRADRLLASRAVADEQRPDEIARVEAVFGEHGAHPRRNPAAAHAEVGEGGHGPPLSSFPRKREPSFYSPLGPRFRGDDERARHPAGLSAPPGSRVARASSVNSSSHGRCSTVIRAFFHPPCK